jgi:serine protease Do
MSATLMVFTLSVGVLIGTLFNTQVHAARGQAAAPDATPLTVPKAVEAPNEFTKLAKQLQPSVVYIEVVMKPETASTHGGTRRGAQPDDGDDDGSDLFRRFFGQGGPQLGGPQGGQVVPPQALKREASGTGFVVDKNGYIVTNNHVVESADKITVKLMGDSTEYRAKVIGTDFETDLAVIKIDAHHPLQPVTIGNSDGVQVGDWAIAIGSPFTLEESVTLGIVSAMGRDIDGSRAFQRFIQTDAAINPGNSGGPLVNIRGEVIGVNTMIATSRGGSEGVGFALPSNMVVRVYNDIIREGRVTRGSIGVTFIPKPPAETLKGLGVDHGVIVKEVSKGGPSEKAGLKPDDIITAINGKAIRTSDDLMAKVADTPVGDNLNVTVDREGKTMDLRVVTQDRAVLYKDRPEIVGELNSPAEGKAEPVAAAAKFGISLREASADERSMTPDKRGVVIAHVEPDSFAEDIGIQERDIIVAINRRAVNSTEDVRGVAQGLHAGDAVTFHIFRAEPVTRPTRGGRASARPNTGDGVDSLFLAGTLPAQN